MHTTAELVNSTTGRILTDDMSSAGNSTPSDANGKPRLNFDSLIAMSLVENIIILETWTMRLSSIER